MDSDSAANRTVPIVLVGILAISVAEQIVQVFRLNINPDEFIFLTNVYLAANGQQLGLLQTPYAHLFVWLTHVSGDEITQIRIGRLIYIVIWIGSLVLLYRLGRTLLEPLAALAGTVFFALFSFSVLNAASFRIDGLLLPILLSTALLLAQPTTIRLAAAGALSGMALALSIKAVLWAPALIGVTAVGLWYRQDRLKATVAGIFTALVVAGVIMAAHHLISGDGNLKEISAEALGYTASYMFVAGGLFPKGEFLALSMLQNPATWGLLLAGVGLAVAGLRSPKSRQKSLLLLALPLPLLSVAFYANAFPYSYVILVPTGCLLAGMTWACLATSSKASITAAATVMMATAAMPLARAVWESRVDGQHPQRQILSLIHEMFPEPVPYIDVSGMVASFPPSALFPVTRFNLSGYQLAGDPRLTRDIETRHPLFLIVNTPVLDVWNGGAEEYEMRYPQRFGLLPEDKQTIRDTYAHYWGLIYLAGRQWHDVEAGEANIFDLTFGGEYTIIAARPVLIDGRWHPPGGTVTLDGGTHSIETTSGEADLRLLWGNGIQIPDEEPSRQQVFPGFSPLFPGMPATRTRQEQR